ncbi:unnamed protein product [Fusarium equiseti]|uniref:Uncharacterized protein n=1 Tax=Fusarium equiseti TaxID=61235 RepID=A0A8J2ISR3_FUSEQ|nr:unnamed protein product [Fusarium equiseti]
MRARYAKPIEDVGFGTSSRCSPLHLLAMSSNLPTIQQVSTQRSQAGQHEIALHILDQWEPPRVPWRCHPLRASLCKKQTHWIVMKFGIIKFENFDLVYDIDVRWDIADRGGILKALLSVSLYHSSWRHNHGLGLASWITPEDGMESNSMPNPQFDLPPLPVEQRSRAFRDIKEALNAGCMLPCSRRPDPCGQQWHCLIFYTPARYLSCKPLTYGPLNTVGTIVTYCMILILIYRALSSTTSAASFGRPQLQLASAC